MTKSEIIDAVQGAAHESGHQITKKEAGTLLDSVFDIVAKEVAQTGKFAYPGFGTFAKKHRKARSGRNPQTGAPMEIKASNTVSFKPTPALKDLVNSGR